MRVFKSILKIQCIIVFTFGVCGVAPSYADTSVEDVIKVRFAYGVKVIGPDAAATTSVPLKEGFFKDNNLDVEISSLNTGPAFQLLADGAIDILEAGSASGINLVNNGAKIIGIATVYNKYIFYPAVLKNSRIRNLREIEGKTVGLFSGAGSDVIALDAVLESYELTKKDIKGAVAVGTGASAIHALNRGDIDIYFGYLGAYNSIETSTDIELRFFDENSVMRSLAFAAPTFWVNMNFMEQHGDEIGRFMDAVKMGVNWARENPEKAVLDHFSVFPNTKPSGAGKESIDRATKSLLKTIEQYTTPLGSISRDSVEQTLDTLVRIGAIKEAKEPEKYYTWRYVETD